MKLNLIHRCPWCKRVVWSRKVVDEDGDRWHDACAKMALHVSWKMSQLFESMGVVNAIVRNLDGRLVLDATIERKEEGEKTRVH